ncbi:hypothetical protein HU200_023503 [Digitaria exilis]|uniref:Uncharacterized protein n=1 Tax=Digitaria exilis TaxID=1010633 RepID=A0A835C383_9POAL|nr:hypothetical protein HU200_023503 [Digitaria exilis]
MAPKSFVLAALLIVLVTGGGQVPRCAGLGAAASATTNSVLVSGVVPCATGNSISAATAPVFPGKDTHMTYILYYLLSYILILAYLRFPLSYWSGRTDAAVQLVCSGTVVASATADGNGAFLISLSNVEKGLVTAVLGNQCKVVVTTPLAACDKTLASATGTLTAQLKLLGIDTGSGSGLDLGGIIGQIVGGLIGGILSIGTQSFSLV